MYKTYNEVDNVSPLPKTIPKELARLLPDSTACPREDSQKTLRLRSLTSSVSSSVTEYAGKEGMWTHIYS